MEDDNPSSNLDSNNKMSVFEGESEWYGGFCVKRMVSVLYYEFQKMKTCVVN